MVERIMDYRSIYEIDFGVKKVKYSGSQGLGCCPIHPDKNPSFSFNLETGQNKCFSCNWEGNAYTLAKELNMENPRQYIDDTWITPNNHITSENKLIRPLKSQNNRADEVEIITRYKELKNRYKNRINIDHKYKNNYIGKNDNGETVFIYPNGIKIHKKYWIKEASLNSSNQIFMIDELEYFDTSKPLHIFEGEKDALVCPFQGVSFSCGAMSIPNDITPLYDFQDIIIIYDNDEQGINSSYKLAKRIKEESSDTIIEIAQWDKTLPKGYDVYDDYKKTSLKMFEDAIENAVIYELPIKEKENNKKAEIGYSLMKPNELIKTFTEIPKSIIRHLLVEKGVTIISGTDGVGKTWFGLQMAQCISTGNDFLGFNVIKKPVLVIQFELSSSQLSSRIKKLNMLENNNIYFSTMSDKELIFTNAWEKIVQTINEYDFVDGVVFIDNLYTSTDKDVSKNHELKPLLTTLNQTKNISNNAFVLIGHHNKHDGDTEPLLTKSIITGGKTLTNYVNNVFQIGTSSMGADLRRGKLTKLRDSYTELLNEPLLLRFDSENCLFYREGVIQNEKLHCEPVSKRWEYKVLIDFSDRNSEKPDFDRKSIELFISGSNPNDTPDNVSKKTTRWLKKMVEFGFVKKIKHNSYKLRFSQIRQLESIK